jgi:hypothetical protein
MRRFGEKETGIRLTIGQQAVLQCFAISSVPLGKATLTWTPGEVQ